MTATAERSPAGAGLHARAVALLDVPEPDANDPIQTRRLIYELHVHQLELEMQNAELRAAEHRLELSQAQYQDLFDLAPAGYVNLDARGFIQRANRAAGALLGVAPAQLIGRSLAELSSVRELPVLVAHLRAAARGPHAAELCLERADGSSLYARIDSRPAANAECWSVLTDISHEKLAEAQLQRANQELEARVRARTEELAGRNRELESALAARAASDAEKNALAARLRDAQRLESLGLLAGGIAHDFNNVLTGVLAHADLLLIQGGLSSSVEDGLRTIQRAAQSAADLTRQLLVYAGQGQLHPRPVPLDDLIDGALKLLRARLPARVELCCELAPGGSWLVRADSVQVEQVITNLVTNAVEALGERAGHVRVRARLEQLDAAGLAAFPQRRDARPGAFAVLEVEDDGPGIAAPELGRIFDPFFTTKFTGRGLGLASVLGIVHAHDAALRVHSEPGRGTRFEIAWPVAAVQSSAPASGVVAAEARWRGAGRVLLVDDDPGVRSALSTQLGHLGFEVEEAAGAARALEIVRERAEPFRLAVIDRTMPGLSGDALLASLHELHPALPALMVSGYSSAGPVEANARVAFLGKPMTVSDLAQAIRALLDRTPPRRRSEPPGGTGLLC